MFDLIFQRGEFYGSTHSWLSFVIPIVSSIIGASAAFAYAWYREGYKERKQFQEQVNYFKQILKFLSVNINTQEFYLIADKEELSKHSFDIKLKSLNFDVKIDILKTISYNDLLKIHKKYAKEIKDFSEFISVIFNIENIVKQYPEKISNFNTIQDKLKTEFNQYRSELENLLNTTISSPNEVNFYYQYVDSLNLFKARLEEIKSSGSEVHEIHLYYRLVIDPLNEILKKEEVFKRNDISNVLDKSIYIINEYSRMINEYQTEFTKYLHTFSSVKGEFKKLITSFDSN